ncbi:uncharacterized protein LOC116257721 isoform X1 [Nymphaea colorata]|nr:uncharacterized protein LOC116257721 isoform X1 [Nymphaea colorata]
MAFTCLGIACKSSFALRPPLVYCARKVRHTAMVETVAGTETAAAVEGVGRLRTETTTGTDSPSGGVSAPVWKKLSTKELGVRTSMIAKPTRVVLNQLRKKGYEVYLVGGCVRDLILKRVPKDFDVITSADLHEVKKTFSRCEIIGRRFPICHVHIDDSVVEVSSFRTIGKQSFREVKYFFTKPPGYSEGDYARWRNCMGRDFTINGLMLDPYADLIYDYMGGMEDIRKAKVRTVIPAHVSFQEDCARILRAVRIAARLGFRFTKETANSLKFFSSSVLRLDKSRLLMEMNYMLAFGSAEASLRLLWKYGLLEILLPIQASYFVSQGFRRRDKRSNMLLALFSNLDKVLAPDQPCHSCLWVAILAFHLAMVDEPRDPLVVSAFSLAVRNGGDLAEAVKLVKLVEQEHDSRYSELLEPQPFDTDREFIDDVLEFASAVKAALGMMTDEYSVSQAMAKYPQAPFSDLVFIPCNLYWKVCRMFDCVGRGKERGYVPKRKMKIDYRALYEGDMPEVRHMFARVVFDTVYPSTGEVKS